MYTYEILHIREKEILPPHLLFSTCAIFGVYTKIRLSRKGLGTTRGSIEQVTFVNLNITSTFVEENGFVYMYDTQEMFICKL